MKRYRIRKDSPLYYILITMLIITAVVIIPGLGNHFIDGMGAN